jgi:orotate phosphoribosyltransferase
MSRQVKLAVMVGPNVTLTDREELLHLLERESSFERELTLISGRSSNYYIDCKRTLYLPRGAGLEYRWLFSAAEVRAARKAR